MARPRRSAPDADQNKEPFDIDEVFRRLRQAVKGLPKAAMFELRDRGHASPFEVLVGTLISVRTRDEVTLPACLRLFAKARTPEQLARLGEAELSRLLRGVGLRETKVANLLELSRRLVEEHNGQVPDTLRGLTAFRGVGPKVAALTLALGFHKPAICVDVHVHRVVNRWGYVETKTPEQTMEALEAKLPERYWVEINERLVPFGKFICTGKAPKCPACPLLSMCRQVDVDPA